MWGLIIKAIGRQVAKYITKEVAEEIFKKYGMKFLMNFAKKAGPNLQNMGRQEIMDLAQGEFQKQTGKLFRDKVFSKSNAKRFASVVNKKIDKIEDLARGWSEREVMRSYANRLNIGPYGRPRRFERGINRVVDKTLRPVIMPMSKSESFWGGYLRGLSGETLAQAVNRVLELVIAIPRGAIATPKYRTFVRTIISEIKHLKTMGEPASAAKLWHALKTAFKAANKPMPGVAEHLLRYNAVGNVAGRSTVGLTAYFGIGPEDETKRNREKFKKTIKPFTKKYARIYIQSHVRRDGTRVRAHYRTVQVAAA